MEGKREERKHSPEQRKGWREKDGGCIEIGGKEKTNGWGKEGEQMREKGRLE